MELNNKTVADYNIDGVDPLDYPDFCDTHFAWAEFEDGTALTDAELDQLAERYPEVLSEAAYESLC